MSHHLAQVNIAKMRDEIGSPVMHGFASRLAEINALAERSPGFVWRFQTAEGDATALRLFDDPLVLFNMSVWESVDALRDFTYRSDHLQLLRAKSEWVAAPIKPHLALWWLPRGTLPTPADGVAALNTLAANGASAESFTFASPYPPPAAAESVAS